MTFATGHIFFLCDWLFVSRGTGPVAFLLSANAATACGRAVRKAHSISSIAAEMLLSCAFWLSAAKHFACRLGIFL